MLSATKIDALVREACGSIPVGDQAEMAIPSYTHWNPLVRWIIRKRLNLIASLLRRGPVPQMLDFGCGLGLLSMEMASHCQTVHSADLFTQPVRHLSGKYNVANITVHEAENLRDEIPAGSLDAIVAADVLEHIDDLEAQLSFFESLLQSNGAFYLSGPTENILYKICRKIAGFKGDYHVRSVYDIENCLHANGWQLVEAHKIPIWLPISMFRISIWNPPVRQSNRPAVHPGSSHD